MKPTRSLEMPQRAKTACRRGTTPRLPTDRFFRMRRDCGVDSRICAQHRIMSSVSFATLLKQPKVTWPVRFAGSSLTGGCPWIGAKHQADVGKRQIRDEAERG